MVGGYSRQILGVNVVNIKTAKCPKCGANLELPQGKETGFCMYCGTKVIMEKERMEVIHKGSVSSLPLCPNCGNVLTEGNRIFTCEKCGKRACYICSKLSSREQQYVNGALGWGRRVSDLDLSLCRSCKRQAYASCVGCDHMVNGRYTGPVSYTHLRAHET